MAFDGIDPFASEDNPAPVIGIFGEEVGVSRYLGSRTRVMVEIDDGGAVVCAHLSVFGVQRLLEELRAAIGAAA